MVIRVVCVIHEGLTILHKDTCDANFAKLYKKLVQEEPVTCAVTGTQYEALPHPHFAIIDVCLPLVTFYYYHLTF